MDHHKEIRKKENSSHYSELIYPFLFASISSCTATAVIQPIDTLKVRLQIAGESAGLGSTQAKPKMSVIANEILASQGMKGFYNGLTSALLRQVTYGTTRIGVYRYLVEQDNKHHRGVPLKKKIIYSLLSGTVGSFVGNPFDVVLVRIQADQTLPPEKRRNYKGIWDAFTRMYTKEGVLSFWRGCLISIMRASVMTSCMLSTNDEVKEKIEKFRGVKTADLLTNVLAAAVSGVACSFCSLPFDNVKTKLQKMKKGSDGQLPYSGILDCFRKTFKREGIRGFWTGYSAFYMRVAPHATIVLILDDFLHRKFDPNYHH